MIEMEIKTIDMIPYNIVIFGGNHNCLPAFYRCPIITLETGINLQTGCDKLVKQCK